MSPLEILIIFSNILNILLILFFSGIVFYRFGIAKILKKKSYLLILSIIIIFFVILISLFDIKYSFIASTDSYEYTLVAAQISKGSQLQPCNDPTFECREGTFSFEEPHFKIYSVFIYASLSIIKNYFYAAKYTAVFFYAIGLILFYILIHFFIKNKMISFFSLILFALTPIVIYFGISSLPEMAIVSFLLLFFVAYLVGKKYKIDEAFYISILSLPILIQLRPTPMLILVPLTLYVIDKIFLKILLKKNNLLIFVLSLVLLLPSLIYFFPFFISFIYNFSISHPGEISIFYPNLSYFSNLFFNYLELFLGFPKYNWGAGYNISPIFLLGFLIFFFKNHKKEKILLLIWIFIPIVLYSFYHDFGIKFIFSSLIFLIFIFSIVLGNLFKKIDITFLLVILFIFGANVLYFMNFYNNQQTDQFFDFYEDNMSKLIPKNCTIITNYNYRFTLFQYTNYRFNQIRDLDNFLEKHKCVYLVFPDFSLPLFFWDGYNDKTYELHIKSGQKLVFDNIVVYKLVK